MVHHPSCPAPRPSPGTVDRIAARKATFPVHGLALVVNEQGQPLTYAGIRKRFERAREAAAVAFGKAGKVEEAAPARGFQFRDVHAKAATDLESSERAQKLLGAIFGAGAAIA